jgi:hypothetical protein
LASGFYSSEKTTGYGTCSADVHAALLRAKRSPKDKESSNEGNYLPANVAEAH